MENSFVIEADHYLTGKPVKVEVRNGFIAGVTEQQQKVNKNEHVYVAPGFIDDQINGYAGIDFSADNLTVHDLYRAAREINKTGVTTFVPTLVTNRKEILLQNFRKLATACRKYGLFSESVPGFHLEGPYISPAEGYRGCHPVEYIHNPSWNEFMEFQEAAEGRIIQVTVAPEVDGAMDFISKCSREGIIVAIGHTAASAQQISQAVDRGARISTHLMNGCANLIHRHNNPIWAQLADDRLVPSIIADGLHLLPEEIKVILKVKGPDNMILVSDVIYLSGMSPGKYTFLGKDVILTDRGMLLDVKENCLAGASLPVTDGVKNMPAMTGCTLPQAINMASVNVAGILGLKDRGMLIEGKRADLLLFTKGKETFHIKNTWVGGTLVS
jgi:N-acetylglucosamine-6-phosphate deacetylase